MISPIAAALLLLPTLSAFAEDVQITSGFTQEVSISDGVAVTTTTITENGVARAPVVSIAPVGGELAIVGDPFNTVLSNLPPEMEGFCKKIKEHLDALAQSQVDNSAPELRKRMAEQQIAEFAELSKTLGKSADEFDAIKPLIATVENLRNQKSIIDDPANSMMGGHLKKAFVVSMAFSIHGCYSAIRNLIQPLVKSRKQQRRSRP